MKPPGTVTGQAPQARYRPGQVVGEKYQLVRLLSEGGMGMVWVAHQTVLDVFVALKVLHRTDDGQDGDAALRMLEEARTAARLGHAAIVRVFDFGRTELGDPFIVLELLDGEDLADLLARQRRLPSLEAVGMMLPIAHALATAHEHGIVHRDVKPENIFLARTESGLQPKLLDFGVARFLDRPGRLTLEGMLLGTPEYMSPEQARGRPALAAADVWSFCVVLYEVLTGSCPFRGPNYHTLLRAICELEPPSLLERGVDDAELWRIVRRGLEKQPEARYGSMRELGQELARWLLAQGVSEDVTGTSLRRTWLRDEPGGEPPSRREKEAPRPGSPPEARVPAPRELDLVAIAELSRLGDLQRQLLRSRRWRSLLLLLVLVGLVLLVYLWMLLAAGVVPVVGAEQNPTRRVCFSCS